MLHPISTPLGLHMGPASPGQQPPSLKRGVGTRCHSSPAAGPAALAPLPLRLGSCLQGGGPSPVGPWPPWPAACPSQRGPGSSGLCGSPSGTPIREDRAWTSRACLGLKLCLQGWRRPSRAELLAGPQAPALAEAPGVLPRDPPGTGSCRRQPAVPVLSPPPVLATGPRRGPHGNICALPGHLWMDRSSGVLN